ncbi:hypothetical protein Cni_G15154 [Canna indica]|uniref:Uncharacterized protein n=1 Tax=Canna indica TaxID=4628 RepID=A0AAQ3QFE5_9LILI|nr:hypothetical protein Cni_G15154 [Canna indica]
MGMSSPLHQSTTAITLCGPLALFLTSGREAAAKMQQKVESLSTPLKTEPYSSYGSREEFNWACTGSASPGCLGARECVSASTIFLEEDSTSVTARASSLSFLFFEGVGAKVGEEDDRGPHGFRELFFFEDGGLGSPLILKGFDGGGGDS